MHKRTDLKLYNVLFPFWMILLFPPIWIIVLPGNFIIDSIVFIISLFVLKIADKKQWYKRHILKIFLFGMLSDIIGSGYLLLMMIALDVGLTGDEFCLTAPAVVISSAFIFILNYFVTFKKADKLLRLKLSLIFAVATAPYTFFVPSSWLYG